MTYSKIQAKEYILQSQGVLSLISLTNPSYSYADWKRVIKAFELCSKAIEADPYLAEAYFGRASCSQLFMNMIARGSEVIQEYADNHISLEKENTFIQDLIKAEQLGSYEAKLVLENDPDVSRLRDIYKSRNSSPKNPTNVNTNSQTTNSQTTNLQTTNSQTTNSQQGDCFIATAAYSSTEHPDLDTFRNFRDSVLLSNSFGTFLVALYYKIGPRLAKYVKKNKSIQIMSRNLLSNFARFLRKI
ncbi:CFI-box-CTERM domain-containing protein [Nostoc sp. 'Peltigera malacea cyanobiont' DB3992]|uniref:CFI-box-CTERM domain-containing protein n=1 Tax=Nostoc sp. 'Peltigera malacea cyanobiont' DB3992 TaxID=1206980 RepID=UPI000C03A89A|nr:CFI-box-CTERM domain-containing protein [Nostoc sp. 'Peltigera malacea cyanobiont' DB3992]PHM07896.1 hypothetical protein CK516_24165 [Nostoc sp. 'Peltigera malacea cyanobiont' DB3992]